MFTKLTSATIYVRISKNLLHMRHIENGKEESLSSIKQFSTKRLLVGQLSVAEELIKKGVEQLIGRPLFKPSLQIIIQPLEMYLGGLSQVEERVYQALALAAGGKKTIIWMGRELLDEEVLKLVSHSADKKIVLLSQSTLRA